jgi:hypothetical protein
MLMGVRVDTVKDRFSARMAQSRQFSFGQEGAVPQGALAASNVDSWKEVNAAWKAGKPVARDSVGHFYINRAAGGDVKPLRKPRIALYRSHVPSMDEGWTRWLFDQFAFEYTRLYNKDVLDGALRKRFDAIVFPDQGPGTLYRGYPPNAMPEEYAGGLGSKGEEMLKQFAGEGGTLIFLNDSTAYAVGHLGAKLKNSVGGVSSRQFYSPGSLLHVSLDPSHPLTKGLPKEITIWSEGSPAWEDAESARVIARYPASNLLASGWLLGEKYLANKSALVEVPVGTGRMILFGMRPQYRAQSYQTFKLLFNALAGY